MNEDEDILDEDLDDDLEEDTEDAGEDLADDADSDDEFEYDEDGNIIIPDIVEDEGDEAVEEDVDHEATSDSKDSNGENDSEQPDEDHSDMDKLIAQLEAKIKKLEAQGKETLSKLGVNSDDVMEGLVSLAAEADGITPQEYLQKKATAQRDEQARALLQQQEFEKLAASDLAELQAAYPETMQYKHIRDLPDDIKKKFGRFRDAGLSAKEAYAAANPDGIRTTVATAVKKQSLRDSKSHLHTTVPKGSKDNSVVMPKSELANWRDLFPEKSDKEIIALYKETSE